MEMNKNKKKEQWQFAQQIHFELLTIFFFFFYVHKVNYNILLKRIALMLTIIQWK